MALIALLVKLDSPDPSSSSGADRAEREAVHDDKFRTMKDNAQGMAPPQRVNGSTFVFHSLAGQADHAVGANAAQQQPGQAAATVQRGARRRAACRAASREPYLVEQYAPEFHRRHDVKPGITGLAQVNGRSDLTYSQMMAYDLEYVDHHPFSRDLAILAKTLAVVLRKEGAR
jgi:lipopolysaccharide/colanic/teichoic acid biosynthesis glycosyltransferase